MPYSPTNPLLARLPDTIPGVALESRDVPGSWVLPDRIPSSEPVRGGLMPQSDEESAEHSWRSALTPMSWLLPPVSAFVGGQRLAEGWDRGDPLLAGVGLGQVGLAMPGVWNTMMQPVRTVTSRLGGWMPRGRGPGSAPAPLQPAGPPPPAGPAARAPQQALDDFHALRPDAAFPRIAGTTHRDASDAYLALRQANGSYDDALTFLAGNRPGAESLLRAWQSHGVDAGQALRYYQGLAQLERLDRPTRLNSLALPTMLGAGTMADAPNALLSD